MTENNISRATAITAFVNELKELERESQQIGVEMLDHFNKYQAAVKQLQKRQAANIQKYDIAQQSLDKLMYVSISEQA